MQPEDFDTGHPGEVRSSDGVFCYLPDPLPPSIEPTHDLVRLHGDAMHTLGRLSDLDVWVDTPEIILSPLIHREATESSNIETTTGITLSDIYEREAGATPGGTRTEREDILEATNYVAAIEAGIDRLRGGDEIDVELLRDLHELLLSGGVRGEEDNPGQLRQGLVGIDERNTPLSEARFVPPPASNVPYLLGNLVDYVERGPTFAPLVDIALVHYQFETIHPFEDGNGRLGRLLVMLLLYEWDLVPGPYLYPSSYFNANRETYLDALLAVSQADAWDEWVEFFIRALSEQGEEAYTVARELIALRDSYREQYRGEGAVIQELLEFIIQQPYFTEGQAVDALERSQPAVNAAINKLWDDQVVVETTGQQRNRRYEARDVLAVVEPY